MGLGAYQASDPQWLGMLGMHGTWEANWAMHDCDVMICIGARFDDRITGRLDAFAPGSAKIHVDIDPSSINKNVKVDIPIIGDCAHVLEDMMQAVAHQQDRAGQEGARRLVETDRQVAGEEVARLQEVRHHHQAAIRDPAAL
jgi:acetolactate synthase-1/2/3 large subunit